MKFPDVNRAGTHPPGSDGNVFWGELAPTDHLVQLYGDDTSFLDSLEGFVTGGLLRGECVIVIATAEHRRALDSRLSKRTDIDLISARSRNELIEEDAEKTLARFMVERQGQSWPDDQRFAHVISGLLERARTSASDSASGTPRKVRAFGEMVAVLWAQGNTGATVRLEHLWNHARRSSPGGEFSLFCAYPRIGFTQGTDASLRDICASHTKVVSSAS